MQSTLFEKDSLRFVPCRSQRGCDTRSAQRVNSDAPVVGIYDQTDFASADAKLCEAVCLHFSSRAEFVMTSTLPAFMDQRTDNRVQCVGDGEHDGDEVEHERECYIELDGAHHALGERDEVRQLLDFSSTSAISAASTAMSLPTPPIAMPTSAALSAGASFTPSPIMQTLSPAA